MKSIFLRYETRLNIFLSDLRHCTSDSNGKRGRVAERSGAMETWQWKNEK